MTMGYYFDDSDYIIKSWVDRAIDPQTLGSDHQMMSPYMDSLITTNASPMTEMCSSTAIISQGIDFFGKLPVIQPTIPQNMNNPLSDNTSVKPPTKEKKSKKSSSDENSYDFANQPMKIIPTTKEQEEIKRNKKGERNRQAAIKSYQRKKLWQKNLQISAEILTTDNVRLKNEVAGLQQELKQLKNEFKILYSV